MFNGVRIMADYKAMYLKMMNAAEEAMEILIKAQRECEELYMSADDESCCGSTGTSNDKNRVQNFSALSPFAFTSSVSFQLTPSPQWEGVFWRRFDAVLICILRLHDRKVRIKPSQAEWASPFPTRVRCSAIARCKNGFPRTFDTGHAQ